MKETPMQKQMKDPPMQKQMKDPPTRPDVQAPEPAAALQKVSPSLQDTTMSRVTFSTTGSVSRSGRGSAARKLPNGDSYEGGWHKGRPHGRGSYTWANGSTFEGMWVHGRKHGSGCYMWATGALYDGEWQEGAMQGFGRYEAADGSVYVGSWVADEKCGLGDKHYRNGDVYEGLWRNGHPEGPGMYRWTDGSEYNGEWVAGKMHGRGTFVWPQGERYDGEWHEGTEHGRAVFTWPDKSYYDGVWAEGMKHGVGVWVTLADADDKRDRVLRHSRSSNNRSFDEADITQSRKLAAELRRARSDSGRSEVAERELHSHPTTDTDDNSDDGHAEPHVTSGKWRMTLQKYVQGILVAEEPATSEFYAHYKPPTLKKQRNVKAKKAFKINYQRHKQNKLGETIFKGHRSYDLMLNLQLGVRWSVQRHAAVATREIVSEDFFHVSNELSFPRMGSKTPPETPPHESGDFKWKDYCPVVFHKLREAFAIDQGEYVRSLCGDQALREMSSPGKSGSVFFLSHDERFVCKTMKKEEMRLLRRMLHQYYVHMCQYPDSLLVRFYGLYRVKPHHGRKVRFVVMGNLFNTELPIHRTFDLKGSTVNRLTPPEKPTSATTTYKDLDLDFVMTLPDEWCKKFKDQVERDCALLQKLGVMDYSLLLGVHFHDANVATLATGKSEPITNHDDGTHADDEADDDEDKEEDDDQASKPSATTRLKLERDDMCVLLREEEEEGAQLGPTREIAAALSRRRWTQRRPSVAELRQLTNVEEGLERSVSGHSRVSRHMMEADGLRMKLGVNLPAVARPKRVLAWPHDEYGAPREPVVKQPTPVFLYFGIIDILQEYNSHKVMEHYLRSMYYDSHTISAVDPAEYARRCSGFLNEIFEAAKGG